MPVETISVFFLTSVMLALSPGPDNLFVLAQSMVQGTKAGVTITLGLCTGLLFHSAAVILGIAALLQTSEVAFTLLKLSGAGYLLYLAKGALTAPASDIHAGSKEQPLAQLYIRGIIMNITNPKVSIFFLAFLPQFVLIEQGNISTQLVILSVLFILAALLVFNCIALLSGAIAKKMKQQTSQATKVQDKLNKLAGIIFIGLAIKLLFTSL
jgi:threonine/homoserine/homoserine lactone efflux protein